MPRPNRSQISFVAQPTEGAPGADNLAAVVVIGVDQVRFSLTDVAGVRVGSAYLVKPDQGRATWRFKNPKAGVGYRIVAEDSTRDGPWAARSAAFDVVAPVPAPVPTPIPVPSPTPPPLQPAIGSITCDPNPPVVGTATRASGIAAGVASVEWVRVQTSAGFPWQGEPVSTPVDASGGFSFVWTPAAVGDFVKVQGANRTVGRDSERAVAAPAPAPTPVPGPTPPPGPSPVVPAIVSVAGDMASAKVGQPVRLTVKATGLPSVDWVVVRTDAAYSWRTTPASLAIPASGEAVLDFTPAAPGEFCKVMAPGNPAISRDSAPVPGTVPPTPSDDAAFAFAWRAKLKHGVNIERGRAMGFEFQGKPYRSDTAFWLHLKDAGITHCRFFYPWAVDVDMLGDGVTFNSGRRPSIDKIRAFIAPMVQCARAGLTAWADMTDVVTLGAVQAQRRNLDAHFTDFCREIAAQPDLTPDRCVIGGFNELVTWDGIGSNAEWNPVRMETHALIRSILPQHLIAHGGANWCAIDQMTESAWQAPPDKRSIGSFHQYMYADAGQARWRDVQARMDDFEARHGIPIIAGEAGDSGEFAKPEAGNVNRWVGMIRNIVAAAPRTKQAWWTVTDPGWGYSLIGSDGKLLPAMEAVFRETAGGWSQS